MSMSMFAVLTIVASVSVHTSSCPISMFQVNISMTMKTSDPSLSSTISTGHTSSSSALVTRLDHACVRNRHQPHFISEHSDRMLIHFPWQRRSCCAHADFHSRIVFWSMGGIAPTGLSSLSEGLKLIMKSRNILHVCYHHALGCFSSIANMGGHVIK